MDFGGVVALRADGPDNEAEQHAGSGVQEQLAAADLLDEEAYIKSEILQGSEEDVATYTSWWLRCSSRC